mgnify:FL=1
MTVSKERLTSELLHYMRETEALRSERTRLEIELSKTKDELERYRKCWEASCYTADELTIPLETA